MINLPENIFKTVFENSPGSLLVKADLPHFTILAASETYLAVTSSTRETIVGKGFFETFPEDDNKFDEDVNARNVFTKVIETRQKIDVPTYRFDVYNPDKKAYDIRYWSCCNTPIFDTYGKVAYILNTVVDITAEVKAKEAAIENESRLRLAAEAAALATWDLNLQDMSFIYSPRLAEIFGHPPGSVLTLADVSGQVNAEDLQNIVVKSYYESLITGKYLYEARIYWPDESLHWIKTQGIVITDEKKQPVRLLGTILDITESKRDEVRKNDFIAMASHELKTPLTSLKAYIQLLTQRLGPSGDHFINNALSKANNQVNKMTDLIHGFLDLSKLESGKLHLKLQDFDIGRLINDTVMEISALNSGHLIDFDLPEDIIVKADQEKIEEVISNFLSNAMKYSHKGSKISIVCKKLNGSIQVSVIDEGIGINVKDHEKLFHRFYRVENEKMKNITGFGIGLYLSSEIIQRHKGKIWVESEEGKGSTFYFSLPLPTS
ncbi:MAG TPA: ATP-binding protein [Mucilaginibacter sp.]|jgi:two-component system CheB/CheR fusion protein